MQEVTKQEERTTSSNPTNSFTAAEVIDATVSRLLWVEKACTAFQEATEKRLLVAEEKITSLEEQINSLGRIEERAQELESTAKSLEMQLASVREDLQRAETDGGKWRKKFIELETDYKKKVTKIEDLENAVGGNEATVDYQQEDIKALWERIIDLEIGDLG